MERMILFDMNDTLVNTMETAYLRNKYCFELLGRPFPAYEEFVKIFGQVDFPKGMFRWAGQEYTEDFLRYYPSSRPMHLYKPLYPIRELIDDFRSDGYKIGLISNSSKEQYLKKLDDIGIEESWFDVVSLEAKRPNPDVLVSLYDTNGLEPKQVIFVSDSLYDYYLSEKLGLNFIAVLTGSDSMDMFLQAGLAAPKVLNNLGGIKGKNLPDTIWNSRNERVL
ncbi:HAD family hydrolase [Paenibacillus periandrae]|uniref:HAD family hydrolase n=1 Tax=Paenibacillus periandrae TaxID=1761741 RepID=UPI001F09C19F|nr:HAD-IA family hydrolase [Paenibacillus periandrae]